MQESHCIYMPYISRKFYDDCFRHPEVAGPHYREKSDAEDEDETALSDASSASADTVEELGEVTEAAAPRSPSITHSYDGKKSTAHPLSARSSSRKRRKVIHYSPAKERGFRGERPHRKHTVEEAEAIAAAKEAKAKVNAASKAEKVLKKKANAKKANSTKTEGEIGASAAGMGGVMELLRQMLEKQNELIAEMHHKAVEDAKDPYSVTAKKLKMTHDVNDGERYVHVEPKWTWRSESDNAMERLMRSGMQVARLIDENAELRRDKLVRDMVVQSNMRTEKDA